jgi:hypothetical protein
MLSHYSMNQAANDIYSNPYAQQGQGDFYSSGPYETQGGYQQQSSGYSQIPSGNGGYSGGGAYGQSAGYGNGNEYEMNSYGAQSSQSAGTLSDFFAQVTLLLPLPPSRLFVETNLGSVPKLLVRLIR